MELVRYIDTATFKTQPFLPNEEKSSQSNELALEKRMPHDVCVVIVANQSSTEPVKIPTEDPTVSFTAKSANPDEPAIRPLQLQENDEPLIAAPLRLCASMGAPFASVVLPSDNKQANQVRAAVDSVISQLTLSQVNSASHMACKFISLNDTAGNVEIFDFDAALLSALLSEAENTDARFVLALDACAPRVQPRHLLQLFDDARHSPEVEIVTSWSAWARHYPFLISVDFLKKLQAVEWNYTSRAQREAAAGRLCGEVAARRAAAAARSGCEVAARRAGEKAAERSVDQAMCTLVGDQKTPVLRPGDQGACALPTTPLLDVRVKDSVFGEERLDVSTPTPALFASFAQELKISALEAVALSRKVELCENDKERKALLDPLTDADKRLLSAAHAVCELANEVTSASCERGSKQYAADLSWAAKWGARNKIDFPLFAQRDCRNSLVYLDTAATAQRCYQAIHAEREFEQNENANVYRGSYSLSMQATFHMNDARAVIEKWINADRRQTVLTANATASLNLVAQAWGEKNIGDGDLIVVPACEHHSNLLPWMLLASRKHARIGYVPLLPNGDLDMLAYQELLAQKPKLVCVAHIGNVLGIVNPVEEMAATAHEVGARFALDAAQSFPHMKLDVKKLGADFVAFSAHKAYGPNGVGGLWISPDAAAEMEPLAGGGGTVSHVDLDSYYWRAGAIQHELGTPQLSQLFGFAAAVEFMDVLGMDQIARHSKVLTQLLVGLCEKLGFVRVWGHHDTDASQTGLVSMSVAGLNSSAAGGMLGKMGVAVRSGAHCAHPLAAAMGLSGTVRMSFGVYNTPDDVLAACAALIVAHDLGQQEK